MKFSYIFLIVVVIISTSAGIFNVENNVKQASTVVPSSPSPCKHTIHTKIFQVPMRDGVTLNTVVTFPTASETTPTSTVLDRTPYGASGGNISYTLWAQKCFIGILQDFRGRYASKGQFSFWEYAANDAYDTMEWISKQPWSNGKVFSTGASADAIAALLQPQYPNPCLKSNLVNVGSAQLAETVFQGGALRESLIGGWLTAIGEAEYINTVLENEKYSEFWVNRTMDGKWKNINFPTVHVAGWFDIFQQQSIDAWYNYRTAGTNKTKNDAWIFMGPHGHCQNTEIKIPNNRNERNIAADLAENLWRSISTNSAEEKERLNKILQATPQVQFYVGGPDTFNAEGAFWVGMNDWPQYLSVNLYLSPDMTLQLKTQSNQNGHKSFVYNPLDPVPTLGGNNLVLPKCGPWDQSKLEQRHDVLSFTSEKFKDHVAMTGRMKVELYVSSNATDTDFTAKLLDVYPNGNAYNLQDGIVRMRWRNGISTEPNFIVPGKIYKVEIDLWSFSYIWNPGHALRLDISSSNFPRFSLNLNNGNLLVPPGLPVVAENTIYMGPDYPSSLIIPLVDLKELKKHIIN